MEIKNNKVVFASVAVRFFKDKEEDLVFAECPALQISTYGKNITEAKKMFAEAFSLWLQTTMEDGDIHETLRTLGWKITKHSVTAPAEEFKQVPFQLLTNRYYQLPVPVGA